MQRTGKQNNSLHLYISLLADTLAAAGYDMRQIIKVEITPTPENVKETMIRPIMKALFPDVTSTAQLTTKQINQVYDVVNRATAERLGVSIEFPSEEKK